ncbi:CYTH domain-containing protein [Verrucomicrobiaceae bacterium R5-34]|uniref:CYTH domain-containing protein n=1 Tax=Oceaniferula flava TaxID=2800421 RepID=A0AAE2VCT5_9BACT|nr:CYTH domain-containing protein [Oceaniferula flavus]MBK1830747.1 CYTH domain-containing protein [Verrucomicrobiaceae bacterium R5-34]MBK1856005.1 CYTH domain-containing protein [Oceaniferula flavus]MBM1137312.1 CYTH domain-containing protein [Oceaniferula flavus]
MATEIERKFLLHGEFPRENGVEMVQGYLCKDIDRTVRIRLEGERAVLTIKGRTSGISRPEYEYEIPADEAQELLGMAVGPLVEKTRYYHRRGGHVWEIDVFKGDNAGLAVAEIELGSEDEPFEKPAWVGNEVSGDSRYANSALSVRPFTQW